MVARTKVRISGPLAPFAAGFSGELARLGYTALSARLHLQLMAHVSRWLASERLDAAALTPAAGDRFLAARRAAGYANHRTALGRAMVGVASGATCGQEAIAGGRCQRRRIEPLAR